MGLLCLGSWSNTFKIAKWRFELYYVDFVLGAFALAALAAFTLGTLGSELSFNDRIAVAGLRSQAFALAAGFLFGVGNLLLVAAISLVGIAVAFPLALSLTFLVAGYFEGMISVALFSFGAALLLFASISSALAARIRSTARSSATPQAGKARRSRAIKGIVVGVVGGVLIGGSAVLGSQSFWGDLGLGAYAGLLMFAIGLAVGAIGFDLMFMNIALEGGRVTLADFLAGNKKQHLFGVAGGAIWAAGTLAGLLAQSAPTSEAPAASTLTIFLQSSVLLNVVWGVFIWKELSTAPGRARNWIWAASVSFAAGVAVLALRLRS